MSRKIDFSKKLSVEDTEYVHSRPWLVQDAQLSGLTVRFADGTLAEDTTGEVEEDEDEETEETEPYEGWVKKDFKTEISNRNKDREAADEIIPESDKNDDLRNALLADDAKSAEGESQE